MSSRKDDQIPMYDVKIIIGNCNAKIGGEHTNENEFINILIN